MCWESCKYRLGKFNCLWTLPYQLCLFSQKGHFRNFWFWLKKSVFQNYLFILAWSLVTDFYNTFVCLVLLWFQHVRHTSQWGTQGTKCGSLVSIYLDKYKRSVFFSSTLLYVYWSFCLEKKLKTARQLSFAKSLSLSLLLIFFCVRDAFCKVCNGF